MPVFRANGAELFYEEVGQGQPILFLHGLGSCAGDWAAQMTAFSDRFRCIAMDFRGSGQSRDVERPNGPFNTRQFAADAVALLDHLGASPAHIVGLSMGGAVTLELGLNSPHVARTLTVVNSAPAFIVNSVGARAAVLLRRVVARLFGPRGMAKMLAPKLFPGPENEALRTRFIEGMARNRRGSYIASQIAVLNWSVLDRIGEIEPPTLVVSSEHDYAFLQGKEVWVAKMKHATLETVSNAHHALPMEMPAAFNVVLDTFLARHATAQNN